MTTRDERDEAVRILEEAASHIDTYGWQRNAHGRLYGKTCTQGAVHAVADISKNATPDIALLAHIALGSAVAARSVCGCDWAPHWNDVHCRNGAEASDMLRFAAKDLAGDDPDSH